MKWNHRLFWQFVQREMGNCRKHNGQWRTHGIVCGAHVIALCIAHIVGTAMDLPIIGLWLLEQKKVQVLPIFRRHMKLEQFSEHILHTRLECCGLYSLVVFMRWFSIRWLICTEYSGYFLFTVNFQRVFFLSFLVDGDFFW